MFGMERVLINTRPKFVNGQDKNFMGQKVKSTTIADLAVPVSGFYRDIVPFTNLTDNLQINKTIKGRFIRRITTMLKLSFQGTQSTGSTAYLSQLLGVMSAVNAGNALVEAVDGQSSILAAFIDNDGKVGRAIDPSIPGTTATSYVGVYPVDVNSPSLGMLRFSIPVQNAPASAALTAGYSLAIGAVVYSTDDLVGTPYARVGQSFATISNVSLANKLSGDMADTVFDIGLATTTGFSNITALTTPDGNLAANDLQQLEFALAADTGNNADQGPAAGAALAIATGNSTTYHVGKYRSEKFGQAGFTAGTNMSGAWVTKNGYRVG